MPIVLFAFFTTLLVYLIAMAVHEHIVYIGKLIGAGHFKLSKVDAPQKWPTYGIILLSGPWLVALLSLIGAI